MAVNAGANILGDLALRQMRVSAMLATDECRRESCSAMAVR
jgi:hypothetical protein